MPHKSTHGRFDLDDYEVRSRLNQVIFMRLPEAERWLAPILGYDPDTAPAVEAATADAA